MPRDYVVIQADFKEDWNSPQYGPFKCYSMKLEETPLGSGVAHDVEMNQKPTTAAPQPGEEVYGDIMPNKNPDFPTKFKKASKDGAFSGGGGGAKGGGTFRPRDPAEIAGARHAHNLLVAAHSLEPLPANAEGRAVQERIDNLEAMACTLDEKTAAISDAAKGEKKPEGQDSIPF